MFKHGLSLIPHFCKNCGKMVSDYRKIYCFRCYHKFLPQNQIGSGHAAYKDGRTTKLYKCKICSNLIDYHTKFYKYGNCKYCSNQLHGFEYTFMVGKKNANYKNGEYSKNKKCINCGKKLSNGKATRCHSCAMKKRFKDNPKSHPWFGYSNFSFRYFRYNQIHFHSSWEANFAKWCDCSGIKWQYEPKAFELNINNKLTTYTPDFYLPEFDLWIEIKGYWYQDAKQKFDIWKLQYSVKYNIFDRDKLQNMSII